MQGSSEKNYNDCVENIKRSDEIHKQLSVLYCICNIVDYANTIQRLLVNLVVKGRGAESMHIKACYPAVIDPHSFIKRLLN